MATHEAPGIVLGSDTRAAFVDPGGGANTRLGLFHTSDEVAIWASRAASGPYKSAGDASTNSPGDWDRIVTHKNSFHSNPTNGRWIAPVASGAGGCVIAEDATYGWPEPGNEPWNTFWSERLRDAAFWRLVTGDTDSTRLNQLKTELLWVSSQTFTDFGASTPWCFNVWIPRDSAPTFGITSILTKVLLAYDWIGRANFSSAELDQLDHWFFDAAAYWSSDMDFGLNSVFVDRWSGNYTPTETCGPSTLPWVGGPGIQDYGKYYNNRRGGIMRFTALVGIYLTYYAGRSYTDGRGANNTVAEILQSGKMYAQEFVRFSVYPEGCVGDFERATDGLEIGWGYAGPTIAEVIEIADAFARAGDTSVYDYNTALGLCNTAGTINDGGSRVGQNRDMLFMLQSYYKYPTDQYARYQNSNDSPTDNNRIDGRSPRTTGASWYGLHDTYMVMGNNYFQDSFIKQAYTHTHANSIAYPSSPTVSNPAWTGENGLWPGVLFMFGQMADTLSVDPYSAT